MGFMVMVSDQFEIRYFMTPARAASCEHQRCNFGIDWRLAHTAPGKSQGGENCE
jgi:hypothetical protein